MFLGVCCLLSTIYICLCETTLPESEIKNIQLLFLKIQICRSFERLQTVHSINIEDRRTCWKLKN